MAKVRDYKKTHEILLQVGFENFSEYGFEKTKLRQICRDAKVTTGAFYKHFDSKEALFDEIVEPLVHKMKDLYNSKFLLFKKEANEFDFNEMWENSSDEFHIFIDLFYDNYDVFNLLFFQAKGTKYENILELITLFTEKGTHQFQRHFFPEKEPLDPDLIHIYTYAYYSALLDILSHRYSREKTKNLATELYRFCSQGWKEVMGVKNT